MKITVPVVNAFIDGDKGGNPAGVLLNAQVYSHEERLKIAAAVGLSETAFVSPSTKADFKMDFYTPTMQITHCGHATIAAFSYLSQQGLIANNHTSKETIDGRRAIVMDGEMSYMEQNSPEYTTLNKKERNSVYVSLGVVATMLDSSFEPCIVNTGNSFLLAGFNSKEEVKSVKPDLDLIAQFSEEHDLIGYYIFSRDTFKEGRDACTRMFAPRYGITEESATGMAAGPLGCLLHNKLESENECFIIEQGYSMEPLSPSVITVNLNINDGAISGLMVGGKAMVSGQREIEI
ncbi:MAG TPA: PhzF family phenazine biosynthesis protein [Gimesia maris]|uniref:PhzF family phenazine biosynthesis protein n=1 Tax=Gimesia maris TaxID=122 RepID=A0A3D3R9R0_9PLAN|nr:PhzF family phenazine biosynthesis protein [Gimesia maris]|tara:strand:+ start:3430 stop:4302 length:873 start_codon:yes stop_codon:yes gene_type:complete